MCITALGQPCPFEAKLTSHLTISYSAATAASGTTSPFASSGTASATGSGNSAANFLAALVDELLAGANLAAKTQTDTTGTSIPVAANATSATQTTPVPFGTAVDPTSETTASTATATTQQPQAKVLLAKLARELKALQDQIKSGEAPNPDLLQRLGQTADAVAALMAQPAQPQATATPGTTSDAAASVDALSGAAPVGGTPPAVPASTPPATAAISSDQAAQFLASLGLSLDQQAAAAPTAPPDGSTSDGPAATPSATSQPLPGIADLASKLAEVSAAAAAISPTIAQKLQNLTQKLTAAESDPQALGALTTADDTSGKSVDTLVQSLLSAKPVTSTKPAAPRIQLSSNNKLPVPDALVKATSPTQTSEANKTPAPATAPSAVAATQAGAKADTATAAAPDTDSTAPGAVKPEAKLVADAVAKADPAKTDASDPAVQTQDGAGATAAPVAPPPPRIIPAAYQTASSATVNMGQVAFEMARQIQAGQSRFSIRLDPPELGRVDVKMHVDASGNINARLTVERSETLDMFQRDKGSLERALSQAGVDTGKTNLEFSLKQNPFAGMMGGDQRSSGGGNSGQRFSLSSDDETEDAVSAVPQITLYRGVASSGGVNLFA